MNYWPPRSGDFPPYLRRLTNAKAERLNRILKRLDRDGRGYASESRFAKAFWQIATPGVELFLCHACGSWFDMEFCAPFEIAYEHSVGGSPVADGLPLLGDCGEGITLVPTSTDVGNEDTIVIAWHPYETVPQAFGICVDCAGERNSSGERKPNLPILDLLDEGHPQLEIDYDRALDRLRRIEPAHDLLELDPQLSLFP